MSDIAVLISDMVRSGVDPDLIGRTAELFSEKSNEVRNAKRPMSNAERQAKYRENNKKVTESNESNKNVTSVTEEKEKRTKKEKEEKPSLPKENPPTGVKRKGFSPADRFQEFWELFPRQRRGNKGKAEQAYQRVLNEKRATEEEIINGVRRYASSDEVGSGFAKGAAAWLNDDRWASDYTTQPTRKADRDKGPSYFDTLRAASSEAQASRMGEDGGGAYDAGLGDTGFDGSANPDCRIPLQTGPSRYDTGAHSQAGDAQAFEGGSEPEGFPLSGLQQALIGIY